MIEPERLMVLIKLLSMVREFVKKFSPLVQYTVRTGVLVLHNPMPMPVKAFLLMSSKFVKACC